MSGPTESGQFCSLCQPPRQFKNSTGLRNHIAWKHSGTVGTRPPVADREASGGYGCDVCGMSIRGYAALALHKRIKHGVDQRHQCTECDQTFVKLRALHRHMGKEHGMQVFKCEDCGAEFRSREGWRLHQAKNHLPELPSQVCYICGKLFRMPYQLKKHIAITHKTVLDFSCHLCSRAFKSCQSLKRHLSTFHCDDRVFSCDVCESKFKTRADMSTHRKLHFRPVNPLLLTGRDRVQKAPNVRSFACRYCSKIFTKFPRCKAHEKLVHESAEVRRRFTCATCDKSFASQYYLIHHMTSKHRQRTHRCPHCAKLYGQAYLLRCHISKCSETSHSSSYGCEKKCGMKFPSKIKPLKHLQDTKYCSSDNGARAVIVEDGSSSAYCDGEVDFEELLAGRAESLGEDVFSLSEVTLTRDVHVHEARILGSGDQETAVNKGSPSDEASVLVSTEELSVVVYEYNT